MRVAITGADGFLGWHLRIRLFALRPDLEVVAIAQADWPRLAELAADVDAVIHLAGINRAPDAELRDGNLALATDVLAATKATTIVFANSIQAGNATAYGDGKLAAAAALEAGMAERGGVFVDVRLPNLFGEHGRPRYNSFVATFVDAAVRGETPQLTDREISLLHVQDAAQALIDALDADATTIVEPAGHPTSVQAVWDLIAGFAATYPATGDIPALPDAFTVALFNTYRAALFPRGYPIPLTRNTDDRGWLVETVRAHGSAGQCFVSTTKPGITRGNHFHLRKLERFVVLAGRARILLRRALTEELVAYDVEGETPCLVDMPTGWSHSITNTGTDEVITVFWTNELFDPDDPDTHRDPTSLEDAE